jgi:hypothetical protein
MKEEEIEEFCNENEIFFIHKKVSDDFCFLEIDTQKTNLKSFYFYTENVKVECFRRFVLVGNYTEDFLQINDTNPEFIQPVLKTILDFKTF